MRIFRQLKSTRMSRANVCGEFMKNSIREHERKREVIPRSGLDCKKQREACGPKKHVGSPGCEHRRKHAVGTHLLEDPEHSPVGYGDCNTSGDAKESSSFAHGKRKGHANQRHDKTTQREGDLHVELDLQICSVIA